jgi:PAS domain-containing protein
MNAPANMTHMQSLLWPEDFAAVFAQMPDMCLVLDPAFTILAQNDAHCAATMTRRADTIGRLLFEVFPDNPNDSAADGLSDLRRSLITVLKTRQTDVLPLLKYAIARPLGGFEDRTWRVVNTPILDEKGFVRLIVNRVADVTPPPGFLT